MTTEPRAAQPAFNSEYPPQSSKMARPAKPFVTNIMIKKGKITSTAVDMAPDLAFRRGFNPALAAGFLPLAEGFLPSRPLTATGPAPSTRGARHAA